MKNSSENDDNADGLHFVWDPQAERIQRELRRKELSSSGPRDFGEYIAFLEEFDFSTLPNKREIYIDQPFTL